VQQDSLNFAEVSRDVLQEDMVEVVEDMVEVVAVVGVMVEDFHQVRKSNNTLYSISDL
jgi:hypothetical protein